MCSTLPLVVHVVASDISSGQLDALGALRRAAGDLAVRPEVVHVGPGSTWTRDERPTWHVRAPLALDRVRDRALRRLLAQLKPDASTPGILHVWSPDALAWSIRAAGPQWSLLAEVDSGERLPRLVRTLRARVLNAPVLCVCRSASSVQRLCRLGWPEQKSLLIREGVDADRVDRASRSRLRTDLGLHPSHVVLVALPPVVRASGTFIATWAALLLEKVRADVRLVVPDEGAESKRIRRMLRSTGHSHVVRFADRTVSPAELAALADLAIYLPVGDAPVTGLVWAMAASRPIVASDVPCVTELLAHERSAWLCRPGDPRDATRRCLQALECLGASRRLAGRAHEPARDQLSPQRMLAQYRSVYESLSRAARTEK